MISIAFMAGKVLRYHYDYTRDDKKQDQQQVIDQSDKQTPKPEPRPDNASLKECVLVAVFDKKSINEDSGWTITFQDDAFWSGLATTIVKDVEFLDVNDEIGKSLIAASKATTPAVLLLNAKTQKLVWWMPLPKNGTSEIQKRLK